MPDIGVGRADLTRLEGRPAARRPCSRVGPVAVMGMLARFGLLEWTFAGLLIGLVGAVGLFFLYIVVQLFRNPSRRRS